MHLIPPTTGECVIVRLIVVPKEEEVAILLGVSIVD